MKFQLAAVLALLVFRSAECNQPLPNPPPPEPEPTVWPDAPPVPVPTPEPTPEPSSWEYCSLADEHAASIGCPLKGSGSTSWADVCRNAANNAVSMHAPCIASAKDCPAIAGCLKSTK